MKFLSILFFTFTLFEISCVEPFTPKINDYNNILVVDGKISNAQKPYYIKLSRTSDINNPQIIYESGAVVIISDDEGNSEILSESNNGVYKTSATGIQGIVGRSYKLYIKTYDHQEYETNFIKLTEPVGIDSLYGLYDEQITDESYLIHEGYQFYAQTHSTSDTSLNLLWEPVETYEYHAPLPIEEYYDVEAQEFRPYPEPYRFNICYKTNSIKQIILLKINGINNTVIHPLFFASADNQKKLSVKYSLLINQYNINEEDYIYRNNLKNILSQGNSFYNIQPFQISGNIKNITDPSKPVLGYFTVAGVSQKRIFVSPIQASNYYDWCVPNSKRYGNIVAYGSNSKVYATRDQNGVMGTIGGSCIDCRLSGGTMQKPEYWNDK